MKKRLYIITVFAVLGICILSSFCTKKLIELANSRGTGNIVVKEKSKGSVKEDLDGNATVIDKTDKDAFKGSYDGEHSIPLEVEDLFSALGSTLNGSSQEYNETQHAMMSKYTCDNCIVYIYEATGDIFEVYANDRETMFNLGYVLKDEGSGEYEVYTKRTSE